MFFLASLAARNLTRNFRRTVITSVAVVFGVAVLIVLWGLVDGLDENVIRAASTTSTGDLLLRPEHYPTDGLTFPADKTEPVPAELATAIEGKGVATARVAYSGRVVHGADGVRGVVIGYDPATELKVFAHKEWQLQGEWPTPEKPGVVVGSRLAELITVKLGDELVIEARTKPGAINANTFVVRGIVQVNNSQLDTVAVWLPVAVADDLGALGGARSHVALLLDHPDRDGPGIAAALEKVGWKAATPRDEVADMLAMNNIRRRAIAVMVFMVMLIAGTGIANTVVMAAFERVREIGTLLSLGMRKSHVAALFLMEGAAMGVAAGVLGAVLGGIVTTYFNVHGIDLSNVLKSAGSGFTFSSMLYTKFAWRTEIVAFSIGVAIAVISSVYPAWIAANLNPADAVRAD